MSDSSASRSGIGFAGLLTVLFVGLKLTGYINWSWWWVLGPLWIPVTLVLISAGIARLAYVGWSCFTDYKNRRD